ncbi:MAG: hypothetical protein GF315_06205 [candidate division Zixibacteria bacterium]|nr:hypothetical protein [candidate division Zixibacteria bacterium]
MAHNWEDKLKSASIIAGAGFIVTYLILAVIRMNYPFELEWIEGAIVDSCRWILAGNQLYVAPSIDFVPLNYPPLYFYVSALVMKLIGEGFLAPRLVSIISSIGCMLLIYGMVKRETKNTTAAFLAAAFFAAAYKLCETWYDIAKSDSFHLFLMLAAVYTVRIFKNHWKAIMPSIFLCLAFHTKQSTIFLIAAIAVYFLFYERRFFISYIISIIVLLSGTFLYLYQISDGWYYYYVYMIPQNHLRSDSNYIFFWTKYFLPYLSPILILLIAYSVLRRRVSQIDLQLNTPFYLIVAVGMLLASYLIMLHNVAWANNLMPSIAVVSVLAMICFHDLLKAAHAKSRYLARILWLIILLQFSLFIYLPNQQAPTCEDEQAGYMLLNIIDDIEGDVLVREHGYYSAMVGKPTFAQRMAVLDVMKNEELEFKGIKPADLLRESIVNSIRAKRFGGIITDALHGDPYDHRMITKYYSMLSGESTRQHISGKLSDGGTRQHDNYDSDEGIYESDISFYPITGYQTRPEYVYIKSK